MMEIDMGFFENCGVTVKYRFIVIINLCLVYIIGKLLFCFG